MKLIITGHRESKLTQNNYNIGWIADALSSIMTQLQPFKPLCYSGMADGIDLIFCKLCQELCLPYIACVPFEEQGENMVGLYKYERDRLLAEAKEVKNVKNSWMVEHCDTAIAVWDGNKGGTHNVVQQLVEKKKNFYWVNPVAKVTWKCFI